MVSLFIFSRRFVTHMLDLHLYRSDLDSNSSTAGSNDHIQVFRQVPMWLRNADAFWVSHFDFLRLADIYRYEFDSSVLPVMSNVSIQTFCGLDK